MCADIFKSARLCFPLFPFAHIQAKFHCCRITVILRALKSLVAFVTDVTSYLSVIVSFQPKDFSRCGRIVIP